MDTKPHRKFLDTLRTRLRELRDANGANVTITFALVTVPMIGFVGAAVDYSHANSVRTAMQAAADSTALMLSKEAAKLTASEIQTKGNDYFKALFNKPEATGLVLNITYTSSDGSKVVVGASADVKTDFMQMMGFQKLKVGVDSIARWGTTKMQVALALDTTGSMASDGKMPALKTATKQLLTTLQKAATNNGDVRVAIVPFAKYVNVGKSNVNKSWIDWTAWDAANAGSSSSSSMSGSICYNGQIWKVSGSSFVYGGTCATPGAGICYNGSLWNWNGSNFYNAGACGSSTNHAPWTGCVTDRDQDYDIKNTAPSSSKATMFPAVQSDDCPVEMMGLSFDWTTLKAKVDQLQPDGSTNQPIGLAWAWMALTQGEPMNAPAKGADVQQAIILFSDGLNTENRWWSDQAKIDARQALLCANVKAAGITIYTVLVNSGFSKVMKDCASKPEYYYEITTGQTVTAFNSIGTSLTKLRLAQ